jgi:hypothetical protein
MFPRYHTLMSRTKPEPYSVISQVIRVWLRLNFQFLNIFRRQGFGNQVFLTEPLAQIHQFAAFRAKRAIGPFEPVPLSFTSWTLDRLQSSLHFNLARSATFLTFLGPAGDRFDSRSDKYNFCYDISRKSYRQGRGSGPVRARPHSGCRPLAGAIVHFYVWRA